jgi:Tol biopolymer transport system component
VPVEARNLRFGTSSHSSPSNDPNLTTSDVYLVELATGAFSRFTFDPASESNPVWSGDGTRIAFSANRTGEYNIYWKASNGALGEERVLESKHLELPVGWSPDQKYLVSEDSAPSTDYDFWLLPLTGEDRRTQPYIVGPGNQQFGGVCPPMGGGSLTSRTKRVGMKSMCRVSPRREASGRFRVRADSQRTC